MSDLTFREVAEKIKERADAWNQGKVAENLLYFCMTELTEEVGELAGCIKKFERFKAGMKGGVNDPEHMKEELGDVAICAFLVAMALDIDLGEALVEKFNKTSKKYDFDILFDMPEKE